MPTARRSRTIRAPVDDLWGVVRDPHHLPRWWPRVTRVEDVRGGAFTEVMKTAKGKTVRADFRVVREDEQQRTLVWEQLVEGTPFGRVLSSAHTELSLRGAGGRGAGYRGDDRAAPDAQRHGYALRQLHGQARGRARRSRARSRAWSGSVADAGPARSDALVGLGRARPSHGAAPARTRVPARDGGRRRGAAPARRARRRAPARPAR